MKSGKYTNPLGDFYMILVPVDPAEEGDHAVEVTNLEAVGKVLERGGWKRVA